MTTDLRTVLIVSPYRNEYGPPQTLEHVARCFTEAGYRVVCVVATDARVTEGLLALGAAVHEVGTLTTIPRTLNLDRLWRFCSQHLKSARRIEQIIRAEQASVVYSISEAVFCGSMAARRAGIPSVVHAIGMSIQSPRIGAEIYIRFLAGMTDRFIACSSAVADMLARHGVPDERITVVHNGVAVRAVEATAALPPLDLGPGRNIGMFAAYDPRKGHELFVEAAALIARYDPVARFVIVGGALADNPDSAHFERRVSKLIANVGLTARFVRPGFVPAPEVFRWMRAMDVVVVPSRTEAFAHALVEAMLCERPIVATAVEGNLDAFLERHSGIYAQTTPRSVANAVCEILGAPELAAALGAAAHLRAAMLFDLEITLPALADTINVLLEPRQRERAHADGR